MSLVVRVDRLEQAAGTRTGAPSRIHRVIGGTTPEAVHACLPEVEADALVIWRALYRPGPDGPILADVPARAA